MYQTDRGNYKTKESFSRSCLGRLIILGGIFIVLLIIAWLTVPSEQKMLEEMTDNVIQCINANDSIKGDGLDDAVNNIGFTFTHATEPVDDDTWSNYEKFNRLEYYKHTFFATTHIYNNFKAEGIRCGIGIFGIVIPTIKYSDIVLHSGPMHKGYNKKIGGQPANNEYYGSNPAVKEFHYKGDPED